MTEALQVDGMTIANTIGIWFAALMAPLLLGLIWFHVREQIRRRRPR